MPTLPFLIITVTIYGFGEVIKKKKKRNSLLSSYMFMGLIGIVRTVEGVSFIFLRVCLLESFFFLWLLVFLKKKKRAPFLKVCSALSLEVFC